MIKKILSNKLVNTISKTALVKGVGVIIGVVISVFLGRILGAKGLGTINLANQFSSIILMLVMLGLPAVIIKEIAIALNKNNTKRIKKVIYTSFKLVIPFGITIIVLTFLAIPKITKTFFEESLMFPLMIFVGVVFFQIFSKIYSSILNAYGKIWQSSLVDQALSFAFVGIGLITQTFLNIEITVVSVAILYGIARVLVATIVWVYWKTLNGQLSKKNTKEFIPKELLKVALPLLFIQATNTIAISIDSLLIGSYLNLENVGIYSVAFKIAFVSSFLLMVTNAAIAPKVATMYAEGRILELEGLIQKVSIALTTFSLIFFTIIFFFGPFILSIWGDEFIIGYLPLVILSIGQFFNIAAGCVGLVLTLCNQEKKFGKIVLFSALLNATLNYCFISYWGINGAAIATCITMVLVNFLCIKLVKKTIGISTFYKFNKNE